MELTAFFAYGTLKRGFCREKCWPKPPKKVKKGWIRGKLFDLGPYPGLAEGMEWVEGELWVISSQDMDATIQELDVVEGYFQDAAEDLYTRKVVEVLLEDGSKWPAYTYYFNQWDSMDASHIAPTRRFLIPSQSQTETNQSAEEAFSSVWLKDGPREQR
jgi:gamma-glutamylcyclotransferase (GGCT)/AIG2-like uncharacterized protein YtfP